MNRSLRVERFPVGGIPPGRVVVATTIVHPDRGVVPSPAAPLLAAALGRGEPGPARRRVRLDPVAVPAEASGARDGVLVTASYLDRTGRAVGLGAAAQAADRAAVAVCADLVAQWAGVLRSRRLLVADGDPDCAGARAGIEAVLRAARDAAPDTPVHVHGRPLAAAGRLARLTAAGVTISDGLDAVPDAAVVVFPAHGVSPSVRAEAAARGLTVVDATCPLAALAHRDVRAYADRGDAVVLITGPRDTAAERVSVSQAPESVLPMRDATPPAGLRRPGTDPDGLSFVVQPGIRVEDAATMIAALRTRVPRVRGQHYDALCHAATDRAAAVRLVAAAVDLTLVLGAADDPDAAHMQAEAAAEGRTVRRLEAVGDIAAGWLAGVDSIGVVPTRSAPPELMAQVQDALAGLGPLSAATRKVRTSTGERAPDVADGAAPPVGPGDREKSIYAV
ncbi:4-hydroxy-3-methylbut-2-enyl diphosphate reductase [Actinomadura mexicana]|uniref:4-hydroxy-3-methylbut-2-enyl diphosphate reductase n=2 Tax=Actinomadura mexicana TaxID=134959 RepID=A0A238XM34_9ACTN|nr:4-hydroxy-3-methylbut-2-enyl diphosphate reductase [Actinomadura mexicana]